MATTSHQYSSARQRRGILVHDYSDAATLTYQREQFRIHRVEPGSCECSVKLARSARVAGWLVCLRPECSRRIG